MIFKLLANDLMVMVSYISENIIYELRILQINMMLFVFSITHENTSILHLNRKSNLEVTLIWFHSKVIF